MIRKLIQRSKAEDGVTLIELVIVIAILGVIAAIGVPMVAGSLTNAKTQTDGQNIAILQNALDRYKLENPDDATVTMDDLTTNKYLREEPKRKSTAYTCITGETAFGTDWCVVTSNGKVK
jgi:prepilin-type N-terminal cleavage/methylation domain-containing protein